VSGVERRTANHVGGGLWGPGKHPARLVKRAVERLHRLVDGQVLRRGLQPVLDQQVEVVALVEELDLDVGVELPQATGLAVLLRHQLLVQRGDLDVEVVAGEVEVGTEGLDRASLLVPLKRELRGLVLPVDAVEVEQLGELPLRVVGEADPLVRERLAVQG
jgi:hypothetical protein